MHFLSPEDARRVAFILENDWSRVISRTRTIATRGSAAAGEQSTSRSPRQHRLSSARGRKIVARVPKRATVTITFPQGSNRSYAEVMTQARSDVKLADAVIPDFCASGGRSPADWC